jgi:succinoglycan biosynthesis transport protein ExoP
MAPASAPEADLRDYLRVVWRRKWLVGLVVVLCVAAGVGASFLEKPTYTAKADILLQSSSPAAALLGSSGASLSPTDVATQIQIVTSAPVTQAVSRQLHQPAPQVSVTEVGQTNVIEVAASSHSAAHAARVANAYARAYLTFRQDQNVNASLSAASAVQAKVNSINRQIASLTSAHGAGKHGQQLAVLQTEQATYQAQLNQLQADASLQNGAAELITPATAPSVPSSPKPKRTGLIGLAVGLVLGVGGVLLADTLDDRIRAKEELQEASEGLPVLGLVPALPGWRDRRQPQLASVASPHSATTEAYRQLRTSLQFLHLDHTWKLVQVTSAMVAEGKTTTASNLAVMLAEAGQRVLLVDADLRRPRANEFFGQEREHGLTSVLLGAEDLEATLHNVPDVDGLWLLPSGPIPPNPAELLSGPRMAHLVDQLRALDFVDVVLIDSPPVLPVADAVALAARVDTTLLVTQAGRTTRKALGQALENLGQVDARISGLVLNAVRPKHTRGYRYRYGYGYGYGYRYAYTQAGDGNGAPARTGGILRAGGSPAPPTA